jgi:Flp pilus assembly protein protease CpaA
VKTLFHLVLICAVFYLCGVAGSFLAGVIGALAAAGLHAGPYAVTMIVRVFSALFFCGFVFLAWTIYSRRKKRMRLKRETPVDL